MASLEEVHFKDFYETYVQGVTCPEKLNLFETDRYMCDEYLSDDDSDNSENIRVNKFFPDCGCCFLAPRRLHFPTRKFQSRLFSTSRLRFPTRKFQSRLF